MRFWQRLLSVVGIAVLSMGMTSGVVYADTGTAQFDVEQLDCDPIDPTSDSLSMLLTRGSLDFGTIPAHGATIVEAATPLEVRVKAGCGASPWAVGVYVSEFTADIQAPSIPGSTLTLTADELTYTPSPDAESYILWLWSTSGCTLAFPGIAALRGPAQAQTVGFLGGDTGDFIGDTTLLEGFSPVSCSGNNSGLVGASGATVASWNAQLDLAGQSLVPGASYQSVITVVAKSMF